MRKARPDWRLAAVAHDLLESFDRAYKFAFAHKGRAQSPKRQAAFLRARILLPNGTQALGNRQGAIELAPVVQVVPLPALARKFSLPVRQGLGEPAGLLVISVDLVRRVAARCEQRRAQREPEPQFLP